MEKKKNTPPKEPPKRLTDQRDIKRVGGGAGISLPVKMLLEQGWGPGDTLWLESVPGKGILLEKFKKV